MIELEKSDINDVFPKLSETAVILGNGPSMPRFTGEFQDIMAKNSPVVFGVNRIFKDEYGDFRPVDYYLAIDKTCWRYDAAEIRGLNCSRYFMYQRYHQVAEIPRLVLFSLNTDPLHVAREHGENMGHGFTSVLPCLQLALMQGATRIHFFGIDCGPDKDGKSHVHCSIRRSDKKWKFLAKGFLNGLDALDRYGIQYTVHSDIFQRAMA